MRRQLLFIVASAVAASLLLGAAPPAGAQEPAAPVAKAPVLTGTLAQFIQSIPAVEPIRNGYRGTTSFIPASVAKGKDRRGCGLRQRMLIQSAWVKPKVGRKCVLKGGVWWLDQGTRKVTRARDVAFTPMLSFAEAWGQGASQWTPQQRLVWATQVERPGPAAGTKLRAKSVAGLSATQQLVSAAELKATGNAIGLADQEVTAAQYVVYCNRGLFTLQALMRQPSLMGACSKSPAFIQSIFAAQEELSNICASQTARVFNVAAWGLSLSPADLQFYATLVPKCKSWILQYTIQDSARQNQVTRIPDTTSVSTTIAGVEGATATSSAIPLPWSGYALEGTTATGSRELFGVTAPADWGDPGVPTGYLRLWDAGVSWRQMQPEAGKPIDWSTLDLTMQMASKLKAKVLYVLGDTPAWANGGASGATPPTYLDDAAAFIGQVCSRYRNTTPIYAFEAWNEGNLTTFWTGTMDQLAELTAKVNGAVRACGAGSKVFAASTGTRATNAFVTNYPAYLRALFVRGMPIDGYTVHSYPPADGGPMQRVQELAQFKTMLALNDAPFRPILDTELNYGLAGLGKDRRDIDPATSAAYLSQSFIQSLQYGVDSLFWFLWTRNDYDKLGIQLHAGTAQTIQAWKQTYDWLVDHRMTRCAQGTIVSACQMDGPSGRFTLLWTDGPEVSVNVSGLGTTVQYLNGESLPIGAAGTIGLGIAPVAVRQ